MAQVTDAQIGTIMNQSTDLLEFTRSVDANLLGGFSILGLIILLMVFIVMFLSLHSRGVRPGQAFPASLFVSGTLAMLLKGMNILGDMYWWWGITLIAASVFFLFAFAED